MHRQYRVAVEPGLPVELRDDEGYLRSTLGQYTANIPFLILVTVAAENFLETLCHFNAPHSDSGGVRFFMA